LINVLELQAAYEYEKGMVITKHSENLVEIGPLIVSHPGQTVEGIGVTLGWFYSRNREGDWSKIEHEEQCTCNNNLRHQLHFSVLERVEEELTKGQIIRISDLEYRHNDLRLV